MFKYCLLFMVGSCFAQDSLFVEHLDDFGNSEIIFPPIYVSEHNKFKNLFKLEIPLSEIDVFNGMEFVESTTLDVTAKRGSDYFFNGHEMTIVDVVLYIEYNINIIQDANKEEKEVFVIVTKIGTSTYHTPVIIDN